MDIRALLGDGYRDGMTAEELLSALEGVELPTDQQLRESVNKATKENAAKKRELREKDGTIESLQAQLAALQRENAINKYAASFAAMGYDTDAALASAVALADGDTSTLMEQQSKFLQGVKEQVKAELIKNTPAPAAGKPADGQENMTREAFSRLTLAQKQEFASANPEEYKSMYSNQ